MAENYAQYFSMHEYHQKTLVATNFWRLASGLPEIAVPPEDLHYHFYFTAETADKARAIYTEKERLKKMVKKIPIEGNKQPSLF